MMIHTCATASTFVLGQSTMTCFLQGMPRPSYLQPKAANPDLIVLDLSLAGGGAFNIMKRFRTKDRLAAIPIIALCARDHRDEKDCILKAGAKAVLHKTVAKDELFGVIREILGQSGD